MTSHIIHLNQAKNHLNQAWRAAVTANCYAEADLIAVAYKQVAAALTREAEGYGQLPIPPEIREPAQPWEKSVGVSN